MDYYLDDKNVVNRLIAEYRKHNSLIVAYDFDNTVYDYHNEGHKYDELVELLRRLKSMGCYLIVFTSRSEVELDFVKTYLKSNNIPHDSVNENAPFAKFDGRKIYYNILLDDRAGLRSAYECLNEFLLIIK